MGKVLSSKAVSRETFQVQIPIILQAKKQINIEVIGENLSLLDFQSLIDCHCALWDGPWNFFKDLVVFKASIGLQKPADMKFEEMTICVQCHNVPLAFVKASIIHSIGEDIGRMIEIEASEDGRCKGKFARMRMSLDLSKPLRQGVWVQKENENESICIILLYERLPTFCYKCGKIGHVLRQ